jgi:hypothetical protein
MSARWVIAGAPLLEREKGLGERDRLFGGVLRTGRVLVRLQAVDRMEPELIERQVGYWGQAI